MTKRIHKYLFYTLLTIVYGVFFSVESFYNFEGHSDAKKILHSSSLAYHSTGQQGASTSPVPFPSNHGIRLNKRYHQEDFPLCPVIRVEMPVRYVKPRMPGVLPIRALPFVTIDHSLLRGPPIAA
jgi:hypothetical protein